MVTHVTFFSLVQIFSRFIWSCDLKIEVGCCSVWVDMGWIPSGCWNSLQPLGHLAMHTHVHISALSIIFSPQNLFAWTSNFHCFWAVWVRQGARTGPNLNVLTWCIGSDCSDCIIASGSKLFVFFPWLWNEKYGPCKRHSRPALERTRIVTQPAWAPVAVTQVTSWLCRAEVRSSFITTTVLEGS